MKKIVIFIVVLGLVVSGFFYLENKGFASVGTTEIDDDFVTGELRVSPYGVEENLLNRIIDAKYSLDMWFYRISWAQAEQVFKNLARVGLDVRWIGENIPYEGVDKEFLKTKARMEAAGMFVTDDEHLGLNFNHAKVMIADGARYLIATANLTYSSIWKNREYRFVGENQSIVDSLQSIFDADIAGEKINEEAIHDALLLCPDNCRQKIMALITESGKSVSLSVQYLQDDEMIDLLKKKAATIDLKILVGFRQDDGRIDGFPAGTVRILPETYLHTKNIAIDDQYLIHGSMNMSENSLDNNREIGIIINDQKVIRQFNRQFLRDRDDGILEKDRTYKK